MDTDYHIHTNALIANIRNALNATHINELNRLIVSTHETNEQKSVRASHLNIVFTNFIDGCKTIAKLINNPTWDTQFLTELCEYLCAMHPFPTCLHSDDDIDTFKSENVLERYINYDHIRVLYDMFPADSYEYRLCISAMVFANKLADILIRKIYSS